MRKKQSILVMLSTLLVLCLSGCTGKAESSVTAGKEITLTEDEKKMVSAAAGEVDGSSEKTKGSVDFGDGVVVSLKCPDGWSVSVWTSELSAYHFDHPRYDLRVEIGEIKDKNYNDVSKKFTKKLKNLTAGNIGSIEKKFTQAYRYYLTQEYYEKWTSVSFDHAEFGGQYYVVAKGTLKQNNKKHVEKGSYWYITIREGKLITFQFTAKKPKMDASVIDLFDSIMETVSYTAE